MKDSFILYTDNRKQVQMLTREQKGDLLDAIFAYADGDDPDDMDAVTEMAFSFIKDRIDRDAAKYEEICERRRENGRKGGEASASKREQMQANATKSKQVQHDNDPDNDPDPDNDTHSEGNKRARETKHKHGEYNHVTLTASEYQRLIDDYGTQRVESAIRRVDEYCQTSGKRYKDYNLVIRKWGMEEPAKSPPQQRTVTQQKDPPRNYVRRFENERPNNYEEMERELRRVQRERARAGG